MKNSILKNKYFIYIIIFGYILFLSYLYPIHHHDEFFYAKVGNPWLLQWDEFFQRHGRFLVHIPARYVLQWGTVCFYISKTFVIAILFFVSLKTIDASALKNTNRSFFLLLSIFLFINALFPFTTFMMYYSMNLLYLFNYYIMAILIMIFLQYYINVFKTKWK